MRTPIKITRVPVTYVTENNVPKSGGWVIWPKPDEEAPNWKLKNNERVLWCPWCGEWSIYKKTIGDPAFYCKGYCGWANTNEYYVKHINKLWYEDIPLEELRKMEIPRPKGRR
jgi:hypothetical protein